MFTHCLQIFSSRSLLWRKPGEDDVRRLKAGEKSCRKENDCTAREQNCPCCRENRAGVDADWGRGMSRINREWPLANSCVLSELDRRDCGNAFRESVLRWLGPTLCHRNADNSAYSALRVIGDSLSGKFDFRLIMGESGVFPLSWWGRELTQLARRHGNLKQLTANPATTTPWIDDVISNRDALNASNVMHVSWEAYRMCKRARLTAYSRKGIT